MNEVKFIANNIFYEIIKEDYYIIVFLDNIDNPSQYVILQKSMIFDEKDIVSGTDTYYFEFSEQKLSGYGFCSKISLEADRVLFHFKEGVFNNIKLIEVIFEHEAIRDRKKFDDIFSKIFFNFHVMDTKIR